MTVGGLLTHGKLGIKMTEFLMILIDKIENYTAA
jgi:hypothetical protein